MVITIHGKNVKVEFGEPLSDELFVRRVYLDLAGRIPSIAEAKEFYTKPAESRRDFLIERLIGSEAYASHWYNIWLDALRVQSKFDSARKADLYMWWIRQAVRENMPYDDFVRELLSAEGYIWENPATGYYYRDQSNRLANVEATASLFLGTDIGCAQCHDDPFDVWTRRDYYEFAAFFHSSTYFFPREQTFANLSWEEIEGQRNAMRKDAQRRRLKWNAYEHDVSTTSYVMNQQLLTRVIHPKHFNPRLPHDYQYDDGKPKENIKPTTLFGSNATFENHHDGMRALAGWVTAPVRFHQCESSLRRRHARDGESSWTQRLANSALASNHRVARRIRSTRGSLQSVARITLVPNSQVAFAPCRSPHGQSTQTSNCFRRRRLMRSHLIRLHGPNEDPLSDFRSRRCGN